MSRNFSTNTGFRDLWFTAVILFLSSLHTFAQNSTPSVENVRFEMRTDRSFIVDIYFDVFDLDDNTMTISVKASEDNGATWDFAITNISGDVGSGIKSGTEKHIVWLFGEEHPNRLVEQFRVKVLADDGIDDLSYQPCPGLPTIEYAGKTYHTVQIYNQCWLKENLDVGGMTTSDSMNNDGLFEKYCYNNDPANCEVYGGLYKWDEAMRYASEANTRGICPPGWRIPSYSEYIEGPLHSDGELHGDFYVLVDTIKALYNNLNPLKNLNVGSGAGLGSNLSGFSLLLGGHAVGDGNSFDNLDEISEIWTSEAVGQNSAKIFYLSGSSEFSNNTSGPKSYGYGVRCIKAEQENTKNSPPVAANTPSPASGTVNVLFPAELSWAHADPDNDNVFFDIYLGTDTDPQIAVRNYFKSTYTPTGLAKNTSYYWKIVSKDGRMESESEVWSFTTDTTTAVSGEPCPGIPTVDYEGTTYNTIQIGDQCWLKENLNLGTQISGDAVPANNSTIEKYCYNNEAANCAVYGGLYTWDETMQYSTTEGTRGICPEGWHIPSNDELLALKKEADDNSNKLKTIGQGTEEGAGTNTTGFSALLSGKYWSNNFYSQLTERYYFWSSTERNEDNGYYLSFADDHNRITLGTNNKIYGMSIRCLKD